MVEEFRRIAVARRRRKSQRPVQLCWYGRRSHVGILRGKPMIGRI